MSTQAELRDIRQIPRPRNDTEFERMCVSIYLETYHSPGARRYGRSGQPQSGIDIIFADFRADVILSSQGLVLVQCKHTSKDEPKASDVLSDVRDAAELIRSAPRYQGVYLFILATSAPNSVKLHNGAEDLKLAAGGMFEVEVHTWDKLCQFIQSSDKLWDLYSETPNGPVPVKYRLKVHEYTEALRSLIKDDMLRDARDVNWERANPSHSPAFGRSGMRPPADIWQTSPELRSSLVKLFANAADARAANDMLEYEFSVGRMKDARACLSYILAYRIVGNLRVHDNRLPLVGDKPVFAQKLERLASTILKVQGDPDAVATLALILIMETQDANLHDGALMMVRDMVKSAKGMRWEVVAHVALCIVRFYYIRRHGWTDLARFYVIGDTFQAYSSNEVGLDSPLLGQAFTLEETNGLTVCGMDPLAKPWDVPVAEVNLFSKTFRKYFRLNFGFSLKMLARQCSIYRAPVCQHYGRRGSSIGANFITRRVIDHRSIFIAALNNKLSDLTTTYILITTERSYEMLLGYRAVLQAYANRSASQDSDFLRMLQAVDQAIGWCRAHDSPSETSSLWVVPVYDNPPSKVDDFHNYDQFRSQFTLKSHLLVEVRNNLQSDGFNSDGRDALRRRYQDRHDPFALSCMQALSSHSPILTYFWEDVSKAELMGIGTEHPEPSRSGY